ncbi:SPOR domain-containing protein [Pedobacter sp.]|uniref:SPOR domain-containing protein n=1 Tax=Pedobacter sp. TaxID=1411316 RepID=UPI003D7F57D5
MKLIFTCFLCVFSYAAFAQQHGKVTIIKDPLIDSIIGKRLELNKKVVAPTVKRSGPVVAQVGFRVQIFYGSNRKETFQEQARFKSYYPKLNTYITYKEPNYYLRVGDFRTRLEAQRLMNELRPLFPTLFIFREKINAPILEENYD